MSPREGKPGGASPVINRATSRGTIGSMRKEMGMGPYSQRGLPKTSRLQRGQSQKCLQWAKTGLKQIPQDEKGPPLEPGCIPQVYRPQVGKVLVDDELVTCLLDNGAQLNFITPAYAQEQGMAPCPWSIWPRRSVEPSRTLAV